MKEPKLIKKSYRDVVRQKKVLIGISIFVLIVLIAPSYALLSNFKKIDNAVNVTTANMNMSITQSASITLEGKLPESDVSGLENATPVSITLKNANTGPFTDTENTKFQNTSPSTIKIVKYELKLLPDTSDTNKTTTLDNQYIKYAISTDNGTSYSTPKKLTDSNTIVFTGYNLALGATKDIKLKIWIDENAGQNGINKNYYGAITVEMYQKAQVPGGEVVRANIKSNNTSSTCQNATLTYTEDGITYISGSATCVDFNYLWYSGKMWRITAIYPDGAMKLVTEDAITAIVWGSDIEYDGSYMYQWLNEDFKDTLINSDTILENATWNYSTDGNSTPVRPETIETQKTKQARVGLLNAYEYYNAYRNSSTSANYLNIGYYWWLITPYSDSKVRVNYNGSLYSGSPSSSAYGARPSVILQSNITLSGSGIKTDPYMIVGSDYSSGNVGDNLYDRHSGEYVNFNNEKYRIVSTENNITKLTRNDILRDENTATTPKTAITKNFASTAYFGKSTNTQSDNYWDYYLNNNESGGWLNGISATYKNMMVDGIYYLGLYGSNYKATICKDSNLNSVTTKNCTRYPTDPNTDGYDANKIYIGKVGLPRVGEMFSAQLGGGYSVSSNMWLITPNGSYVRYVSSSGNLGNYSPSSYATGARPSINLSSEVKIACNSSKCDGTEQYPYDLTCSTCQVSS